MLTNTLAEHMQRLIARQLGIPAENVGILSGLNFTLITVTQHRLPEGECQARLRASIAEEYPFAKRDFGLVRFL